MKIVNQDLYNGDLYLMVYQEIDLPGTPEFEILGCLPLEIKMNEREENVKCKTEKELTTFFEKEWSDCDVVLMKFTPEGPKFLGTFVGNRPKDW